MLLFARYSHALMVTMYAIYCVCGLCAFFFFLFILFLSPSLSTSFLSNSVCLCFSPIQYEKEKRKNATQLCVLNLSLMPRIVFILFNFFYFFVVFFFFSFLLYFIWWYLIWIGFICLFKLRISCICFYPTESFCSTNHLNF